MLSPRLNNCPECANIPSLLKKIDCKLAELGNNLYNNISYMLNKPIPAGDILQLITYRRILTYKYCNPNYVHEYTVQMIASRVIRLTLGCVSRCNEPERCLEDPCEIDVVANPTTTSTTTLTTCKSYILYNTAPSAESFLIGNCDTGEPETITLEGLSSVCIQTFVGLNVSANIVVIETNSCTTSTTSSTSTSTSSTSSTTTSTSSSSTTTSTSTTAVPTTTTTTSSSSSTTTTTTTLCQDCVAYSFVNPDDGNGTGTIDGISITTTYVGPSIVAPGPRNNYINCGGFPMDADSLFLAQINGPFTLTISFSVPVNNIYISNSAMGYNSYPGQQECFTINSNQGTPTLTLAGGCYDYGPVGNQICGSWQGGNTGGSTQVSTSTPFTELTITGTGIGNLVGYGFDICFPSCITTTTTSSTSSTSSTTTTSTTTLAPTGFYTIYTHFEAI